MKIQEKFYQFLKWIEKYTQTDMIYLIKGSFWWTFGRVFSFLASFLIFVFLGNFLSKEIFGTYQYVISIAGILAIFCLPGIDTALIRAVAQKKEKTFFLCYKEKIKWGLLGSLISFLVALWYFLNKNFELAISFLIVTLFLPAIGTFSIYSSFWHGRKRFDIQNKYFVLHNLLAALILILIVILTKNLNWVIFGSFFAFTLAEFIFFKKTIKEIKEDKEDKETISFGKHLTIMSLPAAISQQIDNIILWQIFGPKALAIYTFALRIVQRIQEIIPFSALAFPKMSERNLDQIKKVIFKKFLRLFLFSIPFSLFYILICPLFFKIFFPNYLESVIYSQFLGLILIFIPFSFLNAVFLAQMKKKELYFLNFAPQILKIILFFILIPFFSIWGGVFSILISQIFYSVLTLYFFSKT